MKKNKRILRALAASCALFTAALTIFCAGCGSCSREAKKQTEQAAKPGGLVLSTGGFFEIESAYFKGEPSLLSFKIAPADENYAKKIADECGKEIKRLEGIFDASDPDSEIGRLNAAEKIAPVEVSEELAEALKTAAAVYYNSMGAFDPTMNPVKRVYAAAKAEGKDPDAEELKEALQLCGFNKFAFKDKAASFLEPKMELDFEALGRGLVVDKIIAKLKEMGADEGYFSLGGQSASFGKQTGKLRRIDAQSPAERGALYGYFEKAGQFKISAQGGKDGLRAFDSKTGKASPNGMTVITASFGDNLSNAALGAVARAIAVMGPEKGLDFCKRFRCEAAIIYDDGTGSVKELKSAELGYYFKKAQ